MLSPRGTAFARIRPTRCRTEKWLPRRPGRPGQPGDVFQQSGRVRGIPARKHDPRHMALARHVDELADGQIAAKIAHAEAAVQGTQGE